MLFLDVFAYYPGIKAILVLLFVNYLFVRYCVQKGVEGRILKPQLVVTIFCCILVTVLARLNVDEAEHLHCAWLISKGQIPYRDFWQHHLPMLWISLQPIMNNFQPSFSIYAVSRAYSVVIFVLVMAMGWKVARRIWGNDARLDMYLLLMLNAGFLWNFFWLRTDSLMYFFLLVSIYFLLLAEPCRKRYYFLAGVMFSLAMSFQIKQWWLVVAPAIIILLRPKKDGLRGPLLKLTLYSSGLVAGLLPLVHYLVHNKILYQFMYSVFFINSQHLILDARFPVVIGLMGCFGWWILQKQYQETRSSAYLILLAVFVLSTLGSLCATTEPYFYYMGFWLILCAILGCGSAAHYWLRTAIKSKTTMSLLISAGLTFMFVPTLHIMRFDSILWANNRPAVSKLIELCKNDVCVILTPYHPIFSYDAAGVFSRFQMEFIYQGDTVTKKDTIKMDIVNNIMLKKPAALTCTYKFSSKDEEPTRYLFKDMKDFGLISNEDYLVLMAFLAEHYGIIHLDGFNFYVRNDKLGKK